MSQPDIYVTRPHMPPLADFIPYLEKIWASGFVTNNGPMHQTLERELARYLGVRHVTLFNNGTTALLAALRVLDLRGEIITTPFSFVATAHSALWQGLTPVFVDIDPLTLNLDPCAIEAALTPRTAAIMPVHCYGNACDTEAIQAVADRHGLPVVYDAAHAFGVEDDGGSVLRHGTMSALSFHATKVFSTLEGGAVVCQDAEMKQRLDRVRNFGFVSETEVSSYGINGKMSEVNAAFGLLQLQQLPTILANRRLVHDFYLERLRDVPGIGIPEPRSVRTRNYAYFPILVEPAYPLGRDALYDSLKARNIHARRYFYPLISNFEHYRAYPSSARENLPIANEIAERVICLPIHASLSEPDAERVVDAITAPLATAGSPRHHAGRQSAPAASL